MADQDTLMRLTAMMISDQALVPMIPTRVLLASLHEVAPVLFLRALTGKVGSIIREPTARRQLLLETDHAVRA